MADRMCCCDKRCHCGQLATHFVALFSPDGEPTGKKKLMCDAFPKCRPPKADLK